jgi:hypothetical protein
MREETVSKTRQVKNFYKIYERAKARYKKKNGHAQKGKKIKETLALKAKLLKQFPIGDFVSMKYVTKSIGIVVTQPVITRSKYFSYDKREFVDILYATISVLWMSGIECAGETHELPPDSLKKPNMKKVLESGKKV